MDTKDSATDSVIKDKLRQCTKLKGVTNSGKGLRTRPVDESLIVFYVEEQPANRARLRLK